MNHNHVFASTWLHQFKLIIILLMQYPINTLNRQINTELIFKRNTVYMVLLFQGILFLKMYTRTEKLKYNSLLYGHENRIKWK